VNSSRAEVHPEGPFLKQQNYGSKSSKRERIPNSPISPPFPSRKEGAAIG